MVWYTANVCRDLQGLCGGFLQYLQGKTWNIYRFSLQSLQIAGIAGKICKYYRIFPADIAENPFRVPVNPCKHLQCSLSEFFRYVMIYALQDAMVIPRSYLQPCLCHTHSTFTTGIKQEWRNKSLGCVI